MAEVSSSCAFISRKIQLYCSHVENYRMSKNHNFERIGETNQEGFNLCQRGIRRLYDGILQADCSI